MSLQKYQTTRVNPEEYTGYFTFVDILDSCKFYSIGKNGEFELRLLITGLKGDTDENVFNLVFGVWDRQQKIVDDTIETRNNDMQQILATVADKAVEFLRKYPLAALYAEGSTVVRTRLYQREIAKIIDDIPIELRIDGLIRKDDVGFIPFRKGINYDAFLLSIK